MQEWGPEVPTTAAMSDTDHGAHDAAAAHGTGHDDGHGHDEHGHAADKLGPIDWRMWSIGVLSLIVALAMAASFAMATGFNFGL
jgi:ABC-type Zn2+ transport system substrate-binding protein/surface adhesin